MQRPYLTNITFSDSKSFAILHYSDGDLVRIYYKDYSRALMTLINSKKEDVIRDFGV